jgi:protease-4
MSDQDNNTTPPTGDDAPRKESDVWTSGAEQPAKAAQATEPERTKKQSAKDDSPWERELLSRVVFATVSEQRRARRWGIFFKTLTFAYLGILLYFYIPKTDTSISVGKPHTALVEVKGVIADDAEANADSIITGLRNAFKDKNTRGVIVRINSPGGSPVQAGYVNDEMRRLREAHPDIPLYAVVTDICASGGYYIAVGADKIYADKASLVGSIGVLMNGFGFVDTMDKLGVERRLLTAGEHKGFLDPFSPLKDSDVEHMKTVLESTHKQFINVVKTGRGERLKDDPDLFSGLIWTGEQGIELGLVDDLGSSSYVAREIIGAEKIVNYTYEANPLERLAERLGASVGSAAIQALGTNRVSAR